MGKGGNLLLSNVTLYGEENTGVHERTQCKMNQLVYRVTKPTRPPDVCALCLLLFFSFISILSVYFRPLLWIVFVFPNRAFSDARLFESNLKWLLSHKASLCFCIFIVASIHSQYMNFLNINLHRLSL